MIKLAFVFLAVVATAVVVSASPILTLAKFTDTIFCQEKSFVEKISIPTGVCRPGRNASQPWNAQICDPVLRPSGVVFQFSDPACTVPVGSEVLSTACSSENTAAVFSKKNGVESLDVIKCSGQEQGQCGGQCAVVLSIQAGSCQQSVDKRTGATSFFTFAGATLATSVAFIDWSPTNSQCSGNPTKYSLVAAGHCMDGIQVTCEYDNSTARLWGGHGAACPHTEVDLSRCASTFVACGKACSAAGGNNTVERCLSCVKQHTSHSAKRCCRTLSYYNRFSCALCDAL